MVCTGPTFDAALVQQHVTGKKWIVFIHGGEFAWNNNIGAGYAILSANVALASDMGVVAIDYRRSQGGSNPYPAAINDVLQAVAWLDRYLASGGNRDTPGHFIAWLVKETSVRAVALEGLENHWHDIGDPESLARADTLFGGKKP